jgi:hypothetical protein
VDQQPWDDATLDAKWAEMAAAINRLAERVADPGDFPVAVGRGFPVGMPVKGAAEFTDIRVPYLWSLASAFAHGRPWAYQGFLVRGEAMTDIAGHTVRTLTPRRELAIWLPLEAMHLLAELLRLRDRRAGLEMPRMPDGSPDSERKSAPRTRGGAREHSRGPR